MNDLIKALKIFSKYMAKDERWPTHCSHDLLAVCGGIEEGTVNDEDKAVLDELGFFWSEEHDCWASFRFGSCQFRKDKDMKTKIALIVMLAVVSFTMGKWYA